MLKKKVVLAVVTALALGVAGVVAATAVANPESFRSLAASSSTRTVTLHKTTVGKVLATSTGMSLYLFKADQHGKSACYVQYSRHCPALLQNGKVTRGA